MMSINSHYGTDGEVNNTTDYRSNNEQPSAAHTIDDKKNSSSSYEENDILDDGRGESGIS